MPQSGEAETVRRPIGRSAVGLLLVGFLGWGCAAPMTVQPLVEEDVPQFQKLANFPHLVYRIEPGDTIEIQYPYHPEMKHEEAVRPDGKITPKLTGDVQVTGLTTIELRDVLVERTSDRLRNPEVTVRISKFADRGIFVGGEVGRPGVIAYQRGLTPPLQAIVSSGGFRETARLDSVVLVRIDRVTGSVVSRRLDMVRVIAAGEAEPLTLAPHDILYIPRSGIAEANLWVKQHILDMMPIRITAPIP